MDVPVLPDMQLSDILMKCRLFYYALFFWLIISVINF